MSDRILKHLPAYYPEILDFVKLASTESTELDTLQGAVDQLFNDQFVMTAGIQAIKRRELMLGIQADPSIETLDFRRRRLLNRYQTRPPFTIKYLQQQLDLIAGSGMAVADVDVQRFLLTITTNVDNASVFREISRTVETIKPANLIYQQNTTLVNRIVVRERISKSVVTWNYKLNGSWELGQKPFVSYGPEVPIK
jgi:hypothetical protein